MAAVTTQDPGPDKIDPKVLKSALVLIVGALAVIFDTTIVSVALHTLAAQLHTSVATIQWVTTGYLLALGMAVPLSAWGLRRFGGKRLWMFGLVVFLAGSIGSSLAWNVGSLIAWRVVQGVGGGIIFPLLTTLIMQAAGGRALGRTVTIVALPALLGPILGPLAGGAILTHFGWRYMFWVNVPFCVVGLILAARHMPAGRPGPDRPRPRLDLLGLALLAPGIAAVILGLSNAGSAAGFAHPDVLAPLGIGVALIAAFTGYALRRPAALVDVRLLARRPVAVAGFAIIAAATVPFALAGPGTSPWLLSLWLVIRGFGLGAVTIPVMAVAFLGLDKQQIAHSSVVTRTVQQVGGSFGTAVLAVILSGAVAARHGDAAAAFGIAFWWATGFSALAVLLALWLPAGSRRRRPRARPGPPVRLSPWMDRRPATSTPQSGPAPTSSPGERA
jgi:MFS family permease